MLSLLGEPSESVFSVTLGVLVFSFVAEGIALIRAVRHLRKDARRHRKGFMQFIRESKDPTPKVVLFEDAAAVGGVVIALVGVVLAHLTHSHAWDAGAAVAIGVLLVLTGFEIGRDTKGLLIGEAAAPAERDALRDAVESHPEVHRLVELLTMHVGPESVLVSARIDFRHGIDSTRLEEIAEELRGRMREAVPAVTHVFVDPTGATGAPGRA